MNVRNVALTSEMSTNEISASELVQVANEYQNQAVRGLGSAWHFHANVVAVPDPSAVQHGYDYIKVVGKLDDPGAAGYHTDANGQPYALVEYLPDWITIGDHEFCEMLGDPWGRHLYRAPSPDPDAVSHFVRILLELCDPCEDDSQGYDSNGVLLSDYILHPYGNGHVGPFDACGHITHAREVLTNGYISWVEPDGTWKQLTNFGGNRQVNTLGKATDRQPGQSLREWVDAHEEGATRKVTAMRYAKHGV